MTTTQLRPPYQDVQAHYDLSNEFFEQFWAPTMMYTCAYYQRDNMTHEEAQEAKIKLALDKCDLRPGQTLLDVGCGWGLALIRAVENYGVRGIGITLSKDQVEHARRWSRHLGDRVEFRLQGWEEFDEPVDRIVVICATEHFRQEHYAEFFAKCFRLLPAKAPMMIQAITFPEYEDQQAKCLKWTEEDIAFAKFMLRKIFPGGQLVSPSVLCRYANEAGFQTTRVQSLQPHYAKTLDCWASKLAANRERAIELTSQETFDDYMRYLTGNADRYREGKIELVQISLQKA